MACFRILFVIQSGAKSKWHVLGYYSLYRVAQMSLVTKSNTLNIES